MDLKKMQTFIWSILFGLLIFVPGSTLNAIESTAGTATKVVASSLIPTVSARAIKAIPIVKTKNVTSTLKENIASRETATGVASSPLNSHKATTVLRTHSISPTEGGGLVVEAEVTAKSSITRSTKDEPLKDEVVAESARGYVVRTAEGVKGAVAAADYKFAAEFSTTQITRTTAKALQAEFTESDVTTAAAPKAFSGSSVQSTTKVDVTTKRTKASLSRTVTADKKGGRRGAGRKGEKDGNRVNSMVAKSTTAFTPIVAAVTTETTPTSKTDAALASTTSEAITIESLSAAAAAQLVATLFPITTITDEYTHRSYLQSAADSMRAHSRQSTNSSIYNYDIDNNKGLLKAQEGYNNYETNDDSNIEHTSSSHLQRRQPQQQQTHPLQRPKIRKGVSASNNNSKIFSPNGNNNYFSSEEGAAISMLSMQQQQPLRQLRQQYTRQVQQQPHHSETMAPLTPSPTTAAVVPGIDNNLIINDIYSKQNVSNSNKPTALKIKKNAQQTMLSSAPSSNSAVLSAVTTKAVYAAARAEVAAVGGREEVNITTTASSFPTVTTTTIRSTTRRPKATTTPRPTPSVDDYQTVISQAGTHAYLPCNVKQLVKKPISWLRVRDGHILTVDQTTFIADQRFQSIFAPNPERWSLQIKYVQLKDEGTYECQVSTEPKSSAIVTLRVVEPRTELIGEPTRHVKAGSQVKLRCIISQALEPPLFINWFHNQKQIYLHSRRGWRTEIERIELPLTEPPTTTSGTTTTTTTDATTTAATTTMTSPATAAQVEGATTITGPADAVPAASAPATSAPTTTTIHSLANEFGSYNDIAHTGTDTSAVQATGAANVSGEDIGLATTMPAVSVPPSEVAADGEASALGVGNSFAFGTGNTTSSLLAAMAAAAVTMSTAVPTITKTMLWPQTTAIITTVSTTLAAVEVRQITTASLIIPSVEKQDSGNYTCSPSNSAPKTVVLHVLNGEYSASAITSGVNGNIIIGNYRKWLGVLLLLLLQHLQHKFANSIAALLRTIASVTLLCIWPQAERRTNAESTKTAATLSIKAPSTNLQQLASTRSDGREICSLCGGQNGRSTCQQRHDRSHDNKGELPTSTSTSSSSNGGSSSGRNCDHSIWSIDWQTGCTLRLLALMEKT
ncbi:mucin-5AC [Anastrepha ludens]|uniref:mucin-5AC n=1 Tax=Anastrepha ludens TaxID=28586 RepID=UPI0023B0C084|nr:mucin-5AC [Anastrepha ludens]